MSAVTQDMQYLEYRQFLDTVIDPELAHSVNSVLARRGWATVKCEGLIIRIKEIYDYSYVFKISTKRYSVTIS